MKWIKKLKARIERFNNEPRTIKGNQRLIILMLLLVFGMIFTGIRVYKFNPAFALAIFPALYLSLLILLILFVKKGLDLKTEEVISEYKTHLEIHKLDREWLNKELLNEQQLSHNKIGGNIHHRKKMIVEFCIQQLNVSTEESNQEILAQYLDAIKSSNSHELSANAKRVYEAFSYIYKYVDNTLTCKFNVYELEYFKVHVLEHITNTKVDKEIQKPISSINGIQKSDLGAFLHNLFVMCKYYNPQLKKSDFFEDFQKYFDKEVCDTAILSTNSTRITNGQKIFPIDMKKDNFFKEYLKEQQ
ncbi:MAG: hypothetical protein LBF17_06560 [Mediterranea sp.]|jgi:hypothetical protein|nr:hypothetical protein [Mediterranea sp.]